MNYQNNFNASTKQTRKYTWIQKCTFIFLFALSLLSFNNASASHYRYGNISWNRTDASSSTVSMTVNQAWRWSAFGNPVVGQVISNGDALNFGDGSSTTIQITVTSVDAANDNFYGTFNVSHTYPSIGTMYTASYGSCCRIGTLQNNSNGDYGNQTIVNLVAGNLSSPISTISPIINISNGNPAATFNVNAVDPDGSTLTYSLSTAAEVGNGFTQPSGLSVNSSTGLVTFNTVGMSIGSLYSTSVTITDGSGSKSIVDFIIRIVGSSNAPAYDYNVTPANASVLQVVYGYPLNFNVSASDIDFGDIVTLSAVGLQSGMSFTPSLPATGNPVSTNFSWTPTIGQLGTYILNFSAIDNNLVQTNTTVTINVVSSIVQFIAPTPAQSTTQVIPTNVLHTDNISAVNASGISTRITSGVYPAAATVGTALPTAYSANPTTSLNWTPVPADFGLHTISFTGDDLSLNTITRTYNLIPNTEPIFTSTAPTGTLNLGSTFSYTVSATDADVPFGDTLNVVIDPLTPLPSWLTYTVNLNTGTGVLSGTPSCADAGTYTITFIAEDIYHHNHPDVLQTITITVGTILPNATAVTAIPSTICAAGLSQLNANSTSGIDWYTTPTGGTSIGSSLSGANFPVSPAITTTYYAEATQSSAPVIAQTYLIPTSQLINMVQSCGSGSFYGDNNTPTMGFSWTDLLSPSATVTNATIELSLGVVCGATGSGSMYTSTLNSNPESNFSGVEWCQCSGSANPIITLNVNPSNYTKGGTNTFMFSNPFYTGLSQNGALANSYARVTVYVAGPVCVSASRMPITVNIGTPPVVTAANVSGCPGSPITLLGTPAGGTYSLPNPYTGPNTTYTYTYTDPTSGCSATSAPATTTSAILAPPSLYPIVPTNTTAMVSWVPISGFGWFNVRYRLVSTTGWSAGTINANSKNLIGLTACSNYEVQVQTLCPGGSPGPWSASVFFTTLCNPCSAPPTTINTPIVTGHTAKITWNTVTGSIYYGTRYRKVGTTAWTAGTTTTPIRTISGLPNLTCYEFQVQCFCSTTSSSAWSPIITFCTTNAALKGDNDLTSQTSASFDIYPNPTTDLLNVELGVSQSQTTTVKIYDMSGRLVKEVSANSEAGTQRIEISLAEFATGIYTAQVYEDGSLTHVTKVEKK